MPSRPARALLLLLCLALALIGSALLWWQSGGEDPGEVAPAATTAVGGEALTADAAAAAAAAAAAEQPLRAAVDGRAGGASVRGRVLDARTGAPLAGVEVLAVTTLPNFARFEARFRGMFGGLWRPDEAPPRVLATALSDLDGAFELHGLRPGAVFLDGRSERYYVRTPAAVRLAEGEAREGIELLAYPGGRVRGVVRGPEGQPVAGALVSLRPGLNAFFGQVTQRQYRWLEATTGADGAFDLPGVPRGEGYALTAQAAEMALEEVHGVAVVEGQTTIVNVQGHAGATVLGQVVDVRGHPVAGAQVAMIYMDLSRVLFSTDGQGEPLATDADGRFRLDRVAAGAIAFMAAADGLAPSRIERLDVVDGGTYRDVVLELGAGETLRGIVVDERAQPVAGALIEVIPMERPEDPEVVKMALRVREVRGLSGADGRFTIAGLSGERLFVQASKTGYVTRVRFAVPLDGGELKLLLERGVEVKGSVTRSDGQPVPRFRVATNTTELDAEGKPVPGSDRRAAERTMRGFAFGRGDPRETGMRLRAGTKVSQRRPGDEWQEVQSADGRFELRGIPPGRVRVRVRAEGFLEPPAQEVVLAAGAASAELAFVMEQGMTVRGTAVDARSGRPVAEAQVTAYAQGNDERRRGGGPGGMLRFGGDREDFDFLALSAADGRRSALTDGKGRFEIDGLAEGTYRLTGRHPDFAKESVRDVEVAKAKPPPEVELRLGAGGSVEGAVTGANARPLGDALIVAATLTAGAVKSTSTDARGYYRIDGLPPGRYFVFKSRLEESSTNLVYDLLGNMRLKAVTVRDGEVVRKDIADATDGGVRVFGTVRDGDGVVAGGMVTALGNDNEGLFGMGIRARPTDGQGNYELLGLPPGTYFFRVSRFRERPEQASLSVTVPDGVPEFRVDLEMPSSSIAGRVVDTRGQPVAGITVAAGVEGGEDERPGGLLGLIMRNGVQRAQTDATGAFRMSGVAAGTYRLTASGRRGRADLRRYGEAAVFPVAVDGRASAPDVLITVPLAGRIRGFVRDGSGAGVAGADIHYSRQDEAGDARAARGEDLNDLFGIQEQPVRSGADGSFELTGLSPGTYTVRADKDKATSPPVRDVVLGEEGEAVVALLVQRGATLRVRVRNIDGTLLPRSSVQILDGRGRPVTSQVSALAVFRRLMGNETKRDDSGWYEFGGVPPDTYTAVVRRVGKPELRVPRTILDGETVEWDLDMTALLENEGK
jgi:protocatechuate 3,4-dioxygenase beta subunit